MTTEASSADDASFLEEIAHLLETPEAPEDLLALAEATTPLTADTSGPEPTIRNIEDDTNQPRPSRSTLCRRRQRQELEYLRLQVREFEDKLETLQQTTQMRSPATTFSSDDGQNTIPQSSVMWKRIAQRQLSAKRKAEVENVKLREMLQGQLQIARGLELVLHKRSKLQMDIAALENKRTWRADSTDASVYERLKLGLDARYHEHNEVFRHNGLASKRMEFDETNVHLSEETNELGVEILYTKPLPFDFERTCAALWKACSTSYLQFMKGSYWAEVESQNLVKGKFEIPLIVRRQSTTIHTYAVQKRYQESKKREVYTWESWAVMQSLHKAYDGIKLLNHGWIVVESLSTSDPSTPTTIIQSCLRLAIDEHSLPNSNTIGVLSDVLIGSYNRGCVDLFDNVENEVLTKR